MCKFAFRRSKGSKDSNAGSAEIDDEVAIPYQGFLSREGPSLPTYRILDGYYLSLPAAPLTVIDIVETIEENYKKARLILYETAHLNKTWFAVIRNGRIKLCNEGRVLDQALCKAEKELTEASTVDAPTGQGMDAHNRAVRSPNFKGALGRYLQSKCLTESLLVHSRRKVPLTLYSTFS